MVEEEGKRQSGGVGGGSNRKTDRKKVRVRERQLDRQTDGERGTNKNNTGQKMRLDGQREGGAVMNKKLMGKR